MHSRSYKSPSQLIGKRVLVVGAGNSGCDIVRDGAQIAARVSLSIRRGYWFMPKFVLGFPTQEVANVLESIPMPRIVRRYLYEAAQWLFVGPAERFGLPRPNYHFDEAHPTMSDEIPRLAAHGRLAVKPKIARFDGDRVVFSDGSEEVVDLVVFATGYRPVFPFFDEDPFLDADGRCRLHLNVFHPEHPMLFAAGLSQANGSMWRLADYQAQLIARYITATQKAPEMARWFIAHTAPGFVPAAKRWFVPSARHALEVNFYDYRRRLKRLIRMFDRRFSAAGQTVLRAVTGARETTAGTPATIAQGARGS